MGFFEKAAGFVAGAFVSSFVGPYVGNVVGSVIGNVASEAVVGAVSQGISSLAGSVVGGVVTNALASPAPSPLSVSPQPSHVLGQQARGILINAASSIDPLPVIYGQRRIGGTYVIPPTVSGAGNMYLHLVIALCEGEINAIDEVYLDDVSTNDARFAGLVTIEKFTGTDTQAASAMLIAALPGKWTSAHQGKGVAYLHVRLKADVNAFHGLPTVTCDVRGRKIYDPRIGGDVNYFSSNNALCVRDYLTNTRYGRGIPAGLLVDASFSAAANYCDETVSIPGSQTQIRYRCDGIVNVDDTVYANTQRLLGACRGMLVFSGGKYKLVLDKPETPLAFTFNEDNITGNWEIARPGKRDKANKVSASFFNFNNKWQPDLVIQESATYRAQDNGLLLERKIDLPFIFNQYRAAHLAQLEMKSTRFGTAVRFSAFQEGLRCEVGDVVKITHSTPGWTDKPFRIMTIDILDIDDVEITAREYDNAAYTLDALDAESTAPQCDLPDPFSAGAPGALIAASEDFVTADGAQKTNLLISCGVADDAFVIDYEFCYKLATSSQWITADVVVEPYVVVSDAAIGAYDLRVRARNAMGKRSAWVTASYTVAAGATIPVPDVTALNAVYEGTSVWLNWYPPNDVRRLVFEVRCGESWGSGVAYQVGAGTRFKVAKDGTWWVAAKTVSGVYSQNPKAIRVEGAVMLGNVISEVSEAATGWSGAQDGCYERVGGVLQLVGSALFSSHAQVSAVPDIVLAGGFTSAGVYTIPTANRVDIGAAGACQVSAAMDYDVYDPLTQIGAQPVFSALPSVKCPLGGVGSVELEMNLAQTDGVYSGWQPFVPGTYLARLFDFRLKLASTGVTVTPVISELATTVDVPDRTESGQVTTPAGPLAVTFSKPFNAAPKMQITILDAQAGDDAVLSGIGSAGFTVTVKNGGANVSRNVHYLAQGY